MKIKLNQILRPSIICLLVSLIYLLVTLGSNGWDALALIRVGGHFDPRIGGQDMGYDGQFAYQIARDPLNGWQYVDIPAYRYQRILYPILARVLSLGSESVLPWMMLLINLVSVPLGVFLLEKILEIFGQSRWPALGYGLFIGTLMSLRLCLNEPLAYVIVIGGVYLYLKGQMPGAAICMGLAVLTKELTILFVAAIGLYLIFRKFRTGFLFGVITVVPYLLWKFILFNWFQDWGFSAGGAMATSFEWIPYAGWWKLAGISLSGFLTMSILIFPLVIIPSILAIYTSIRQIIRRQINEFTLILFFSAILVPFLPSSNILDPLGVSRALIGLVIAWILFGARNQSKRILSYCLLFALTGLFIWRDAFLPVGTYSKNI